MLTFKIMFKAVTSVMALFVVVALVAKLISVHVLRYLQTNFWIL